MSSSAFKPPTGQTVPFPATAAGRCPICDKPSRLNSRPFCSPRCRDLDLGRWLGEEYRISRPAGDTDLVGEDPGE